MIGQLWINVLAYCSWMTGSYSEIIEWCVSEAEDNKDDRIHLLNDLFISDLLLIDNKLLHTDFFPPIHHPEISTPPPQ